MPKISSALVVDIQEFPQNVEKACFELFRRSGHYSNDVYLRWPWLDCDIWEYEQDLNNSTPDRQIAERYFMSLGIAPQTPLIVKYWW